MLCTSISPHPHISEIRTQRVYVCVCVCASKPKIHTPWKKKNQKSIKKFRTHTFVYLLLSYTTHMHAQMGDKMPMYICVYVCMRVKGVRNKRKTTTTKKDMLTDFVGKKNEFVCEDALLRGKKMCVWGRRKKNKRWMMRTWTSVHAHSHIHAHSSSRTKRCSKK